MEVTVDGGLGKRITILMKARGWTQGQLAAITGLTQPSIWALVSGRTKNPAITTIAAIAQALDVSIGTLMDPTATPQELVGLPLSIEERVAQLERKQLHTSKILQVALAEIRQLRTQLQGSRKRPPHASGDQT